MAGQFCANIFFPLVNTQVTIYLKRYTMHRVTPTLRGNAKAINRVATGENGGIADGQVKHLHPPHRKRFNIVVIL